MHVCTEFGCDTSVRVGVGCLAHSLSTSSQTDSGLLWIKRIKSYLQSDKTDYGCNYTQSNQKRVGEGEAVVYTDMTISWTLDDVPDKHVSHLYPAKASWHLAWKLNPVTAGPQGCSDATVVCSSVVLSSLSMEFAVFQFIAVSAFLLNFCLSNGLSARCILYNFPTMSLSKVILSEIFYLKWSFRFWLPRLRDKICTVLHCLGVQVDTNTGANFCREVHFLCFSLLAPFIVSLFFHTIFGRSGELHFLCSDFFSFLFFRIAMTTIPMLHSTLMW